MAQRVKHLPAMQETWVRSLGREDPLEKEMATHSSVLAWRIPWTEEPGGLQSMGLQRVRLDWADGNDDPICETAKEIQMQRTDFWTLWEKVSVGWFERIALKHVYYHMWNRSPVQGAQGWCTGMGREVRGRFRMGNTCTPMADTCECMTKTTTIL